MDHAPEVIDLDDLPDNHMLNVQEIATMMRVSKMTVYRLCHSGELPAMRFGRAYRVRAGDLRKHLHP